MSKPRVTHQPFTVSREAILEGKARLSACLACGGTWELHGKPPREECVIVDDIESVEQVPAKFVWTE